MVPHAAPCFCEGEQIQILRWRFDKKSPTRRAPAGCHARAFANCNVPCVCTNFKQDATAKILANADPSAGGIYAPQMEEFCKSKKTAVCCKTAEGAVSKGGSLLSAFLVRSFLDEKE
jgi:hypothetical protein